jgi:hypothetical protein
LLRFVHNYSLYLNLLLKLKEEFMSYTITLIPGDGIGPELSAEAQRCIDAAGVLITWETVEAGMTSFEKSGNPLPQDVLDSIKKTVLRSKARLPLLPARDTAALMCNCGSTLTCLPACGPVKL